MIADEFYPVYILTKPEGYREVTREVPADLIERHEKAMAEFWSVQAELKRIYEDA
tara:strand:- start:662 stop:826 length:165 start_codon:yes stop_codon:yes gene_type:complete